MAAQRRPAAQRSAAPPRPVSQASTYAARKQREELVRLGVLAGIIAFFVVPRLPSPVFGFDWKGPLWGPFAPMLLTLFPNDPSLPAWLNAPMLVWLYRAVAGAGVFLIVKLIEHLQCLYRQRTAPLGKKRTYIQVSVPLNLTLKTEDTVALLRTLHGVLPPTDRKQGSGASAVLRWTGMPEQPVKQAISLLGQPALVVSVQKTFEGLGKGTEAEVGDDPLLSALKPGRFVCWADVRLQGPDDLPIAIPGGTQSPLIDSLLPAMAPQAGVVLGDVQIILSPVPDRTWRTAVLARLEGMRADAAATERKVMEQKAAGPAYDVAIRLIAVAEDANAGAQMVQTMGAAFASSAQGLATTQQRLACGPIKVLPAVIDPPPAPVPAQQRTLGLIIGGVAALPGLALIVLAHLAARSLAVWLLPPLLFPLPALILAARWRKQTNAAAPEHLAMVLGGVGEPKNPNVVPLFAPWLGRNM